MSQYREYPESRCARLVPDFTPPALPEPHTSHTTREPFWATRRQKLVRELLGMANGLTPEALARTAHLRAQAADLLRDCVIIDTETTGLTWDAKIVSIGIVDHTGRVLLDTLINPGAPIPPDATAIHGVTDAMVADAPTWAQIYPRVRDVLEMRRWAIYNADYDVPRIEYECERAGLPDIRPRPVIEWPRWGDDVTCVMLMYAEYCGEWNDYYGSYRWQKLTAARERYRIDTGTAHNALSDALATQKLLENMAKGR